MWKPRATHSVKTTGLEKSWAWDQLMESWEKEAGILNTGSGHFAVKRMKLNVQAAMGTQQRRGFPHPTRGR